ncbi:MAG TPA: hypothetical protein VIY52_08775 [Streptosporangiaceae bacterium]
MFTVRARRLLVVKVLEYSIPFSDRNVDTCTAATNAMAPGTTRRDIHQARHRLAP